METTLWEALGRPPMDRRLPLARSAAWRTTSASLHSRLRDLGCGARALRREVADEIQLYGDQHRFLTLLASHRGFRVREIACKQHATDRQSRVYGHPR